MPKAKILIVEDERIVARDIQKSVEALGYLVCAMTSSGEKAIQKADEFRPDLVLMDIVLKGAMDGIEAAGQIGAALKIPVVYLTAYDDDDILQRAKITTPYGYITKPFNDRELHIAIEIALYESWAEEQRERLILDLQEALAKVKTLSGLLPICSYCKKIRDDKGYWNQIESYIRDHSEAEFGHSICRECAKKYYPDMDLYDEDEIQP